MFLREKNKDNSTKSHIIRMLTRQLLPRSELDNNYHPFETKTG